MVLIKLFSRTFMSNKRADGKAYSTIVVREVPKSLKQDDILKVGEDDYLNADKEIISTNDKNISIKVIKIIQKKIKIVRSKRRKRCVKRMGYKQHIGYFKILENTQK